MAAQGSNSIWLVFSMETILCMVSVMLMPSTSIILPPWWATTIVPYRRSRNTPTLLPSMLRSFVGSTWNILKLLALSSLFGDATSCINRYEYYVMCDLQRWALPAPTTVWLAKMSSASSNNNNNNNRVLCIKINELDKNHHVEVEHISSKNTHIQIYNAINIRRFQWFYYRY